MVRLRRNYNAKMPPTSADANRLRALGTELRDFALGAKRALDEEIRSYPTPIPRCDAQFNHAYEQRARLAALLHRIDAAVNRGDGTSELLGAMAEFAALPSTGETVEEQSLRVRITDELARAGAPVDSNPNRSAVDLAAGAG
jgi:hypothetical protein